MKKQNDDTNIKIEELETKVADLDNQLKRALADYRNLEQRVTEGRSELTSYVGMELIKKLLPVLDHLEQALSGVTDEEKGSAWVKGAEMAVKEFKMILQAQGLEEIPIESGFNPTLHEAVDTRDGEENQVLEVARKGYNLNGKVLRPAQVVVGKKGDSMSS